MSARHAPATPLPWRTVASYQPATKREEMSPYLLAADGDNVAASALRGVDDAAYIAHACNAYPRLVEALRNCIAEIDDGDGMPGDFADAIALLRSLGEGD